MRDVRFLVAVTIASACGCDGAAVCRLAITEPAADAVIGPRDDVSNALPGIQVNVTVAASGVSDGTAVRLSGSGGGAAVSTVVGGQAVFSAFTLAPDAGGHARLQASAGSCTAPPVELTIPPSNLLISILDPPAGFHFSAADNQSGDSSELTFLRAVTVSTTAPPGSVIGLSVNGHAQAPAVVAAGGARFPKVVLPFGDVALHAEVIDELGNRSSASASGRVEGSAPPCDLVDLTPAPATVKGFATPVLNRSVDELPDRIGEQSGLTALGPPTGSLELLLDGAGQGAVPGDAIGRAIWDATTIPEGQHLLQVRCVDGGKRVIRSPSLALFVDSLPPACSLAAPLPHLRFTRDDDADPNKPGVQILATLQSPTLEVSGLPSWFGVNGADAGGAPSLIAAGSATHAITLSAPGLDANLVTASVADAAGNLCTASAPVSLDGSGCAIAFLAPSPLPPPRHPLILAVDDVSAPLADGLQYDVALAVDRACLGRTVHLTIDGKAVGPDAPVVADRGQPLGARADFPAAMICPPAPDGAAPSCRRVVSVFATISDAGGDVTSALLDVQLSAAPPSVTLAPSPRAPQTPIKCGDTVGAADDQDPDAPGLQLRLVATSDGRLTSLQVAGIDGGAGFPPRTLGGLESEVTLTEGWNAVVARVVDSDGNVAESAPCELTFAGLGVTIDAPVAGAAVQATSTSVTGSVSVANAAVTLLVDGVVREVRTAVGTRYGFPKVALAPGAGRVIRVDARAAGHAGSASVKVLSDGAPPTAVEDLNALPTGRARVDVTFTAPSDDDPPVASYDLRWSLTPLDAMTFAAAQAAMAPAPAAPGTLQSTTIDHLFPGVPLFVALESLDHAGNRALLSNLPSATPTFARALLTGPVDGEKSGKRSFGAAVAAADFDGDGLSDLAVGAPQASFSGTSSVEGAVYVWFGVAGAGISGAPGLVLRGTAGARAGASLAAGDLDGDGRADLIIGAPSLAVSGKAGQVAVGGAFVLRGGGAALAPSMTPRTLATVADAALLGDPDDPQMQLARLGASVAMLRFDGDAILDLALGAPGAASGAGAAFVVAGGALPSSAKLPRQLVDRTLPGYRLLCAGFPSPARFGERVADAGSPLGGMAHALAVGSPPTERAAIFSAPQPGVVDVDGATSALALLRDGSGASGLGAAFAPGGDSDGNGRGELLLGEPSALAGAGRILRLDGSTLPGNGAPLDVAPIATVEVSGQPTDALGASLAPLTDANGDGALDLLYTLGGHGGQLGARYGGPLRPSALFSPAAQAISARELAIAGDLDGDGAPEVVLLDPGAALGAGRVELFR